MYNRQIYMRNSRASYIIQICCNQSLAVICQTASNNNKYKDKLARCYLISSGLIVPLTERSIFENYHGSITVVHRRIGLKWPKFTPVILRKNIIWSVYRSITSRTTLKFLIPRVSDAFWLMRLYTNLQRAHGQPCSSSKIRTGLEKNQRSLVKNI